MKKISPYKQIELEAEAQASKKYKWHSKEWYQEVTRLMLKFMFN